jgi:hypothetical protein
MVSLIRATTSTAGRNQRVNAGKCGSEGVSTFADASAARDLEGRRMPASPP